MTWYVALSTLARPAAAALTKTERQCTPSCFAIRSFGSCRGKQTRSGSTGAASSDEDRRSHSRASSVASTPSSSSSDMSTTERGTMYEEHTRAYLEHTLPHVQLTRTGGANDRGKDLTGWWWQPLRGRESKAATPLSEPDEDDEEELARIRMTVQCKAESKKLGPVHIRELYGTMSSRFASETSTTRQPPPSMAVLASSAGFSKQCILHAMSTPFPILLLHLCQPVKLGVFECPMIAINYALRQDLLLGRLEVRWHTSMRKQPGSPEAIPERVDIPRLFFNGKRL